jgi:hypothetical protein
LYVLGISQRAGWVVARAGWAPQVARHSSASASLVLAAWRPQLAQSSAPYARGRRGDATFTQGGALAPGKIVLLKTK